VCDSPTCWCSASAPTASSAGTRTTSRAPLVSHPFELIYGSDGIRPAGERLLIRWCVGAGVHLVDMSFATTVEHQGYSHCVSLGPKDILAAKEIILLAAARNKAQTIKYAPRVLPTAAAVRVAHSADGREILADTEGTSICSWIVHNHPKVTFLIDRLAAAALELEPEEPCASSIQGFTILSSPTWFTSKKIVCFSPHPDDTSISAGATLAFLSENNQTVSCICTTGYRAYIPNTTTAERIAIREAEATEEAKLLGALAHFLRLPLYSRGIWVRTTAALLGGRGPRWRMLTFDAVTCSLWCVGRGRCSNHGGVPARAPAQGHHSPAHG